jgi:hypothetical protein
MSPAAALELQLAAYRRMTPEERLGIALRLHQLSCDLSRAGIRAQHPDFTPDQVEQELWRRVALSRDL